MKKNTNVETELSVKEIVKSIEGNPTSVESFNSLFTQGKDKINVQGNRIIKKRTYTLALSIIEAKKYEADYKEQGGKYLAERLREGYIGKVVTTEKGTSYIQSQRGKPYGTVVSIPDENGNTFVGISYIKNEWDSEVSPILGLTLALKKAEYLRDNYKQGNSKCLYLGTKDIGGYADKTNIMSRAKSQVIHFMKRSMSYWSPEVFSYSRGTTPVVYEKYDEIHKNREQVLKSTSKYEFNGVGYIECSDKVVIHNMSGEELNSFSTVKDFWARVCEKVSIGTTSVYKGLWECPTKEWVYPTDVSIGDYYIYGGKNFKLKSISYEVIENEQDVKNLSKGDLLRYIGDNKWYIEIHHTETKK